MDARRLRALVIGSAAAATLGVAGALAADPLPDAPPASPSNDVALALGNLEARAASDLARAEAALRGGPAPLVAVTRDAPLTQSTSS